MLCRTCAPRGWISADAAGHRAALVLLERFKNTPNASSCYRSFWRALMCRASHCSCVIVDLAVRRPAPDCGRAGSRRRMKAQPISEFQVPEAVLALKPGFGSMIRAKTDSGCWPAGYAKYRGCPMVTFLGVAAPSTGGTNDCPGCLPVPFPRKPCLKSYVPGRRGRTKPAMFSSVWKITFSSGQDLRGTRQVREARAQLR